MNVRAFDAVAESYDRDFTDTAVGRLLRQIVWRYLEMTFTPGSRILELNCGTGEDAVWLARREVRVLATDVSSAMLQNAARKAAACSVSNMIEFAPLDLGNPVSGWTGSALDGALSNFGGFNCVHDLRPVARLLERSIRPGGHVVAVLMNRYCAWEIIWHTLHLQARMAFRRIAPAGTKARICGRDVQVWYPSVKAILRVFGPGFTLRRRFGLGVFLPPSYLQDAVVRHSRLFGLLRRLEGAPMAARIFSRFGDHVLIDLVRAGFEPQG